MALYRVDNVFPMHTGDPSDIVLNTLHFESTLGHADFAVSVPVFLDPFWETIYGATDTLRVNYIDWPSMKYRVFDLTQPTPRVPIEEPGPFTTAGTNASSIPTEVAVVASFQSVGIPGEVFQRRYNRIFLGGVASNWFQTSTSTAYPVVGTGRAQLIIDAMTNLAAGLPGPSTLWVQVSNAGGTPRSLPVVGGFVDNSPDTQRRRSVDATSRLVWP